MEIELPSAAHITAHAHSSRHRVELDASERAGCFCCLAIFSPRTITHWIEADTTAMCPHCGIDSVIGDASGYPLEPAFLGAMNEYWFSTKRRGRVVWLGFLYSKRRAMLVPYPATDVARAPIDWSPEHVTCSNLNPTRFGRLREECIIRQPGRRHASRYPPGALVLAEADGALWWFEDEAASAQWQNTDPVE
jgi:hypothetical protein